METKFYQFGVLYRRWEYNGHIFEAVDEQVEFFGKEIFQADFEDEIEQTDSNPDGITFSPMWTPTSEEIEKSIHDKYNYMRDMEIM